ncbi:unnamed protein product [Porites lobata]|uniref:Uncharacterized protein n=1 Tax=Porites lobata TaxID=104759 RepID=A0ABN8NAN9_9CNID|nr:unnamed protein product [Porites lobata]
MTSPEREAPKKSTKRSTAFGRRQELHLRVFIDHRSHWGLGNSQSHSVNVFCVDDPRSEPCVLHELTQNKMVEDAESNIAIRFVDENGYREISAEAVSAKRKLKRIALPGLFLSIVTTLIRAKLRVLVKKMKKSVQARRKL